MRARLFLEIPLFRIVTIIILHSPLDIDGMRVMTFDQIAVIAVHGAHEMSQRIDHPSRQSALETSGKTCGRPLGGNAEKPLPLWRFQARDSRVTRIMSSKLVWRSSEVVDSPVRMWSETVQIARACFPHSAAHP